MHNYNCKGGILWIGMCKLAGVFLLLVSWCCCVFYSVLACMHAVCLSVLAELEYIIWRVCEICILWF